MEKTPKLDRKVSLSLGNRFSRSKHDSPQSRLRQAQITSSVNAYEVSTNTYAAQSPSIVSVCSDRGIDCTTPHKNLNLDDSIELTQSFDTSFSPNGLLSQTLITASPDVDWRWGRRNGLDEKNAKIPDSAYVADCSSTSTESIKLKNSECRTRIGLQRHRLTYDIQRIEQREAKEMEIRRAKKTRADEMLIKRCEKLQEELKNENLHKIENVIRVSTPKSTPRSKVLSLSKNREGVVTRSSVKTPAKLNTVQEVVKVANTTLKENNTFNDFLNDSDMDCLLLEASQQVESKIVELTQKSSPSTSPLPKNLTAAPMANTPTSSCNEKRTSFYMQFLEDDFADDWFVTMDEVVQATAQTKKPRSPFQRYKSMPVNTNADTSAGTNELLTTSNLDEEPPAGSASKIKRHASSHAISPYHSSYRGRQLHLRK